MAGWSWCLSITYCTCRLLAEICYMSLSWHETDFCKNFIYNCKPLCKILIHTAHLEKFLRSFLDSTWTVITFFFHMETRTERFLHRSSDTPKDCYMQTHLVWSDSWSQLQTSIALYTVCTCTNNQRFPHEIMASADTK